MTGLKLDDVLTGLDYQGDRAVCRLVDLDKNAEFQLGFDRGFRELVVYTPPGRPDVISLEPYTQTTDAINLQGRGVDAGLRVLGHGEQDNSSSRWNPWGDRRPAGTPGGSRALPAPVASSGPSAVVFRRRPSPLSKPNDASLSESTKSKAGPGFLPRRGPDILHGCEAKRRL